MADPTTELAKEFLEFNHYSVRKETKFQRSKKQTGTPSDIDIIAVSPSGANIDGLVLAENIVAEVKNWSISKTDTLDDIYAAKFKFMDTYPRIAWRQLKKYIRSRRYDKVVFCLATTDKVYNHALRRYGIKVITTGLMVKHIADFFKNSERNWTYFPEWYNYNVIRSIMYYLFECHKWKDKLTLEDLVWINPRTDRVFRNKFVELNSKFLEELVVYQSSGDVASAVINRLATEYPGWLKSELKSNNKFWSYLVGK